jgi:LuxR family maltose regulon positive regulatory protein
MWIDLAAAISHGLRGDHAGFQNRADATAAGLGSNRSWLLAQCVRVVSGAATRRAPDAVPLMAPPPPGLPSTVATALGIVETLDASGRLRTIGGPLEFTIAEARRSLAEESSRRLDHHLAPWGTAVPDVTGAQHPRSVVELEVLLAIAAIRNGRETLALEWVERAVAHAAPIGLWAPIVAHHRHLRTLLDRYAWILGDRNPAAIQLFDCLRAAEPVPIPPLTDRERAVLHYLPTLMSNAEIAEAMFVSVNTVKTHLKAVYRKLGVDRRRDALLRARQIELL